MSNRTAPVTVASLLVVGIVIGAVVFYSSFAVAGRTLTTYSTSVVTSTTTTTAATTAVTTVTSVITSSASTAGPLVAVVSVAGVNFPASGTNGTVTLFNSGSASTMTVSASLSYSAQTCSLSSASNIAVNPGLSTVEWAYSGGDACSNVPGSTGVSFVGTITFSNGARVTFSGTFQ